MRDNFKKWVYPAHIEPDTEQKMMKLKASTGKSYNQIINEALEKHLENVSELR